jgi:predicted phage terminase large subunit-like protein
MNNTHRGYDLDEDTKVFYVAPTFDQGKRIIWDLLKRLGRYGLPGSIIETAWENQAILKMVNGRKIEIKGADRPDSLRGVKLNYLVMDEYAFMKPMVWEQILRPTLTDYEGDALFIGTPEGKNHFYDLFCMEGSKDDEDQEWKSFSYVSLDNPFLNKKEIAKAKNNLSKSSFKQEYEASFSASGGVVFKESDFRYMADAPEQGTYYIAVDPAGYKDLESNTQGKVGQLDETAIAIVKVGPYGWYVEDLLHGRWGVRETSIRILDSARKYKALVVGIEGGSLKNALMPYLKDQMLRLGFFPSITETTHGGQKKTDRITWALQGRFEHGRIFFREGADYLDYLLTQLLDFPNPLAHDDGPDALSYIDQIATTDYEPEPDDDEDYEPPMGQSLITGY